MATLQYNPVYTRTTVCSGFWKDHIENVLFPPQRAQQWYLGSPRMWSHSLLARKKKNRWSNHPVIHHDQPWHCNNPTCSSVVHVAYKFPFHIDHRRLIIVIQEKRSVPYRMLFSPACCWNGIWKQLEEEERSLRWITSSPCQSKCNRLMALWSDRFSVRCKLEIQI